MIFMKNLSIFCFTILVVFVISCRKDDHISTAPIPVILPDTTNPVLTLTCGDTINHQLNTAFTVPSATANDYQDGDLTAYINVFSTVNVNLTGSYSLVYSVTDSDTNTTSDTVIVMVVNTASALAGTYNNCFDTCQVSGVYSYTATVIASTTTNGAISINNFSAFGTSINVIASVSGSSISIPAQPLGTVGNLLAGSGTVTSTSPRAFNLNYAWTDGTSTEICVSHYGQ